jgi:glycosyltransferase involved in cell wall biosynthesis
MPQQGDLVEMVIPTYRRPQGARRAVESALAETPFQITVLDDNPPDTEALAIDEWTIDDAQRERLRIIRNPFNLGASLNILRSLEVSRAPYTWAFSDDQVVAPRGGDAIHEAIAAQADAAILFWHSGLPAGQRLRLSGLAEFVELIERDVMAFGLSDVHFNRVVRTDVGRRYLRLDARFSHAQPMLGIQIAALADGHAVYVQAGELACAQPGAASGWSGAYLHRFKFDPGYLIPDARLRLRYRAVVARHHPWRETLLDFNGTQRGSIDDAFASDAALLVAHSRLAFALRLEARVARVLHGSRVGRLIYRMVQKQHQSPRGVEFSDMDW